MSSVTDMVMVIPLEWIPQHVPNPGKHKRQVLIRAAYADHKGRLPDERAPQVR